MEKDDMLLEAVESVSEGFVIYDQNDCFITCNEAYRQLYKTSADLFVKGNSFSNIIRTGVERGQYSAAAGNEEEWVAERVRLHQNPDGGILQQRLDNGTWLQIIEHKTKSGYIVGNRVDITALKRGEAELRKVQESLEEQVLGTYQRVTRSKGECRAGQPNQVRISGQYVARTTHPAAWLAEFLRIGETQGE